MNLKRALLLIVPIVLMLVFTLEAFGYFLSHPLPYPNNPISRKTVVVVDVVGAYVPQEDSYEGLSVSYIDPETEQLLTVSSSSHDPNNQTWIRILEGSADGRTTLVISSGKVRRRVPIIGNTLVTGDVTRYTFILQ